MFIEVEIDTNLLKQYSNSGELKNKVINSIKEYAAEVTQVVANEYGKNHSPSYVSHDDRRFFATYWVDKNNKTVRYAHMGSRYVWNCLNRVGPYHDRVFYLMKQLADRYAAASNIMLEYVGTEWTVDSYNMLSHEDKSNFKSRMLLATKGVVSDEF